MYFSFRPKPRKAATLAPIVIATLSLVTVVRGSTLAKANIVVHPALSQGEISQYIYGLGLEWLDNGDGVLDSTTGTLRQDLLQLLTPLRVPVWRFPGGILSDYYQWQDGVGPVANRPMRANPMDGTMHANTFGTDELIAFCRAQNSQPLITANFGTGTLTEALGWQAYFISKGMPVHFWEIGNEIYLAEPTMPASVPGNDRRIYKTAADYASEFPVWARALRANDPSVLVGAIAGTSNTSIQNQGWLDTLLGSAAGDIDFIALHNSFAPLISSSYDYSNTALRWNAYQAMYAQPTVTAEDTQTVSQKLSKVSLLGQSRIAITEHFPLFGSGPTMNQLLDGLDQSRTQGSALFTASLLHTFIRQKVWMANYNLGTSPWFGALITNTPSGLVKTPTYYVYDLYRNHFGTQEVGVDVTGPSVSTPAVGTVPAVNSLAYLDAVASVDAAGRIYLAVINRNNSASIAAAIAVDGLNASTKATVQTLQASQVNAINGTALTATTAPGVISTHTTTWSPPSNWVYNFPPNSVTVFQW